MSVAAKLDEDHFGWCDATSLHCPAALACANSLCSQRSCSLPATQLLAFVPHSVLRMMMRQFPTLKLYQALQLLRQPG